jgi:hypothetical protein
MRSLIVIVIAVAACAGDSPPSSGKCTGAAYDPCDTEDDCDSLLCQNFAVEQFQVCSQPCDAANPCPGAGVCELAVCKPAAPTECTLD